MLFNSLHFIYFFILVTSVFYFLPQKYRWILLLGASCYFYMYFLPIYILILVGTIVIDYFAGLVIEKSEGKKRKLFLIISLIANIGILIVFKYYNFFIDNISELLSILHLKNRLPYLNVLLPVGLSFHTFQAMSYTIEVYRGNQKAEKHFGIYALYVMFYPQLVAGPIERPQNILHQFYAKKLFNWQNIFDGFKHMLWGFFIKIVIADKLAIAVNSIYDKTDNTGTAWLLSTAFFSIQIYCDFAGYSYIAIGSAKTIGFNLMQNFNRPFLATSVSEFWKRWHTTLSSWFRDYVYIPLGGNRVKKSTQYFNLLLIFALSGLWHGANYTYIAWGLLNGIYLVIEQVLNLKKPQNKIIIYLNIIKTYIILFPTWILFRCTSVEQIKLVCEKVFIHGFDNLSYIASSAYGLTKYDKLGLGIAFVLLLFTELNIEFKYFKTKNTFIKNTYYLLLIVLIFLFGVYENSAQFIYFQF